MQVIPTDIYTQMQQTLELRKERIEQLEQLCQSMWKCAHDCQGHAHYTCIDYDFITERMDALGLLEGGEK